MRVSTNPKAKRSALSGLGLTFASALVAIAGCGDNNAGGPDAACDPAPDFCNFFTSCGCDTGAGEKCSLVNDARVCTGSGALQSGAVCVGDIDCAPGTLCADYEGGRQCMAFCDDAHACDASQACYVPVPHSNGTDTLALVCGQVCSLLGQDCDFGTQACYPAPGIVDQMESGVCVDAGVGPRGQLCDFSNDCELGLACITPQSPPGDAICMQMCDRDAPACPANTTCSPLTGHTRTGVCLP